MVEEKVQPDILDLDQVHDSATSEAYFHEMKAKEW